jgi:hypothetical protein
MFESDIARLDPIIILILSYPVKFTIIICDWRIIMNGSDKILYCPETEKEYSLKDIKKLDFNTQKSIMRNWFYSNFEDPADNTPYESAEGGYIYI